MKSTSRGHMGILCLMPSQGHIHCCAPPRMDETHPINIRKNLQKKI